MPDSADRRPIEWYWIPVDRLLLSRLSCKSNFLGSLQTGGFLILLAASAALALYSSSRWPWLVTLGVLFLHGTFWGFLSNGFHEFSHGTVFESARLNRAFLGLFAILSWNNPVLFWASHTEHHKFTLYPGHDYEVAPDCDPSLRDFLLTGIVNFRGLWRNLAMTLRHASGQVRGPWEDHLFAPGQPRLRKPLIRWARIVLVGQAAIIAAAALMHLWMLLVVVTFAPFYGRALQWLCNESQHAGLPGGVPDFRQCSRTIHLNPVLQFLYWHMNYHTEHHLFAAVPCYRLKALHRAVKDDLPPCTRGLMQTWRQIIAIAGQRAAEPGFRYFPSVPARRPRPVRPAAPSLAQTSASSRAFSKRTCKT